MNAIYPEEEIITSTNTLRSLNLEEDNLEQKGSGR